MSHSLLCLGDSYTIGESLPLHDCFPYQLVQLLRAEGNSFHAPEIVAQTGWTTFELRDHLSHLVLQPTYDFVTLLIGVNNQYRGLSTDAYKSDFEFLLQKAIVLADNKPHHVVVLSIPDWGATPFAEGRDRHTIAGEIDAFNFINHQATAAAGAHYVNITPGTREAQEDNSLLAADRLHPSAKEYRRWAAAVKTVLVSLFKK